MNLNRNNTPVFIGAVIILCVLVFVFIQMLFGHTASHAPSNQAPEPATSVTTDYTAALEEEMRMVLGAPVEQFDTAALREVFPGLEAADFEGVEYTDSQTEVVSNTSDASDQETTAAAPSSYLTEAGFKTLVANVSARTSGTQTVEATVGVLQVTGSQGSIPRDNLIDVADKPPYQMIDGTNPSVPIGDQVGCPEDARQCSDGSWVGRTGPDCTFVCPGDTGYVSPSNPPSTPADPARPVGCPEDGIMCPDGTWVGRTGPNCEIVCPEEPPRTNPAEPVACTMDAMQCPDGSYVGRVGPDCEFPVCPTDTPDDVDSFEDCVAAGNIVLESYPRQCVHEDEWFIEEGAVEREAIDYGTDASRLEEYRADCATAGGMFNECASSCGPEAEICADVCVMMCDFSVMIEVQ